MGAGRQGRDGAGYRAGVAGRVVLAVFGSYAIAALLTALLALVLPLARSEAVASATLLSFAVMAALVIYVFAARTLGRATLVLALVGLVLGGALWLAGGFSASGGAA